MNIVKGTPESRRIFKNIRLKHPLTDNRASETISKVKEKAFNLE